MSAITTGRLIALLTRLEEEPGSIALMAEVDPELPAEMDYSSLPPSFLRFDPQFLSYLQAAADKLLFE